MAMFGTKLRNGPKQFDETQAPPSVEREQQDLQESGRPIQREPYRGRYRINPDRTVDVWNGTRYVPRSSRARLTAPEQEMLTTAEGRARTFQQNMPSLDRFEELNRTVPTGAWFQRFGQNMPFGAAPRLFSYDANGSEPGGGPSEFDEMRAINSRLAPQQRPPGSGSSSNMDVAMFREGLPGVDRPGPANSAIIQQFRRDARDAQDYSDFLNWYWPRNNGSLNGADSEFARFRAARQRNPDLDWRSFFGEQQQPTAQGSTPPRPRGVPEDARWNPQTRTWQRR